MPRDDLTLRPAAPGDLPATADVFLASRAGAVPAMPPVDDPDEARSWIEGWDLARREVWLAEDESGVVGFANVELDWLAGLYVEPERARSGVGSALIDLVKARRPRGFALWVFASNAPARAFYARHGLLELEHTDGADNRERSPDLRMAWPGAEPIAYFRGEIDDVDQTLAVLLARRAALTAAVQEHKDVSGHAGRDPDRERQIAERMSTHAPGLGPDAVARIMHTVIEESLDAWESRRTR
jgi:chorismate mutase/GNAT superfamily N-acetyltransferase